MGDIAKKRIEIRDEIRKLGDEAEFPEDLLAVTNPIAGTNQMILAQEMILIRDFDLVVMIVESIGSQVELGTIGSKTEFARKTQTYIDKDFNEGLSYNTCMQIKQLGGEAHTFTYPSDIHDCHLLTNVVDLVERTRFAKYLS